MCIYIYVTNMYIYIYVYMCACMCVGVYIGDFRGSVGVMCPNIPSVVPSYIAEIFAQAWVVLREGISVNNVV